MPHDSLPATRPDGSPTISVVIPALNEERVLGRCLDALQAQTDPVDEIVVVDNGSTDTTVDIAGRYPLVRVVSEPRRGITYARATGFTAAQGAIIARIDADTVVAPEWASVIRAELAAGNGIDAIAGGAAVAELSPNGRFWFSAHYRIFRYWHEHSIGVKPMMYGFNGAFRREAWSKVNEVVLDGDDRVSEDVDLTISLLKTGHTIRFVPRMRVKARMFRSIDFSKLSRYYRTDEYTLARHNYGNPRRRKHHSAQGEAADVR